MHRARRTSPEPRSGFRSAGPVPTARFPPAPPLLAFGPDDDDQKEHSWSSVLPQSTLKRLFFFWLLKNVNIYQSREAIC